MPALIVATIFMAGFGIVVRDAQRRKLDLFTVGFCNYLTASAFYLSWAMGAGIHGCDPRTALIGIIGGVFYGGGFFCLLAPMRWRGLGIVSAIMGLSVLVPMGFSLLLWHETVRPLQAMGAALAVAALPVLGLDRGLGGRRLTWLTALVLMGLFFVNGGCLLIQKWYHTTSLTGERPAFLLYLFATAGAILGVAWLWRSRRVSMMGTGWGMMLGSCNIFANLALLAALDRLPGVIVFPVMQVGIMTVATAFAALAWHEKPGRLGLTGIVIAALAVSLINLA